MKAIILASFALIGFYPDVLFADEQRPCEFVPQEEIISAGIEKTMFKDSDRERHKNLLKGCIDNHTVCFVGMPPDNKMWVQEKLQPPSEEGYKGEELIFGVVQYSNEKNHESVCIVAQNLFVNAVPWFGTGWIIENGKVKSNFTIEEFDSVVNPKSLFKTLSTARQ